MERVKAIATAKLAQQQVNDHEPVWEVRAYPSGELLHTASNDIEADNWRCANHPASVIVPHWRPGENVREHMWERRFPQAGMEAPPSIAAACVQIDRLKTENARLKDELQAARVEAVTARAMMGGMAP